MPLSLPIPARELTHALLVMTMGISVQVYDKLKQKNAERRKSKPAEDGKLEQLETGSMINISDGGRRAVVEFTAAQSAILEQEQRVRVSIRRFGRLDCPVVCK